MTIEERVLARAYEMDLPDGTYVLICDNALRIRRILSGKGTTRADRYKRRVARLHAHRLLAYLHDDHIVEFLRHPLPPRSSPYSSSAPPYRPRRAPHTSL